MQKLNKKTSMSADLGFELVLPTDQNLRLIMEWRNDPETMRMSFHSQPKIWSSFRAEILEEYFHFPDLPPLFVLWEGTRCGFIGLEPFPDQNQRSCEISINIAPPFRGRGIATVALSELQSILKRSGFHALYGDVKVENVASQKAFEAAGFTPSAPQEKYVEDLQKTFSVLRYKAVLNPINSTKVFIIAEAGSNWRAGTHDQNLSNALSLIDAAANAGADAVKFQTFSPENIYVPNAGSSGYLSNAGIEQDMAKLFEDLAMPRSMIPKLASHCESRGIEFMSTPFSPQDFEAVDPYVKRHKIASYEIGYIHLLQLAALSGKPLILSTGAATVDEIAWAVETFKSLGGKALTLLQCTAAYPAEPGSMNLRIIPFLKNRFRSDVGLSDHSLHPTAAPISAVALGATVIEKHFTLDKTLPGPDHAFAITPEQLQQLVKGIRETEQMLGSFVKTVDPTELELRSFARRGIQAIREIKKGDIFKEGENISILRPGNQPLGIHSRYIGEISGKAAKHDISLGHGIQKGDW